jgi:hypothetical protein
MRFGVKVPAGSDARTMERQDAAGKSPGFLVVNAGRFVPGCSVSGANLCEDLNDCLWRGIRNSFEATPAMADLGHSHIVGGWGVR